MFLLLYLLTASPQADEQTLLGIVHFDVTGHTLTLESDTVLASVGNKMHEAQNLKIDIYGYTDNTGSPASNIVLSKERAAQVKRYLVDTLGVHDDRIQTFGFGAENPVASNNTDEGRKKNRRAEIVIRKPDAVITWFENDVKVQPPALRPDWLDPIPNYYLYIGYKVTTGKKSSAHIFYPDEGMLKIGEDAIVIIHGLKSTAQENSFIKNIELQDGGLRTVLEDAASQNDSTSGTPDIAIEPNSSSNQTLVDEKLENLIVAYENDAKGSPVREKNAVNEGEGRVVEQDTISIPAGLGVGILIGEPTGITFKQWMSGKHAFDLEIGWSFPGERIHIAVDYLSHLPKWTKTQNLYPYLGIGGRLKIGAEQDGDQFRFGIRFGAGVEYVRGRFSLYGKLHPVFDIVPTAKLGMEGGIGAYFYFKD